MLIFVLSKNTQLLKDYRKTDQVDFWFPEGQLHPSEVRELVIPNILQQHHFNKDLVVVTHSQQLLNEVLYKVELGKFSHSHVRIHILKSDTNSIIVTPDWEGDLGKGWPVGFFR